MITANQQRVLRNLENNPGASLRTIARLMNLKGVSSVSQAVNSLESEGFLKKVGVSTKKQYQITAKGFSFLNRRATAKFLAMNTDTRSRVFNIPNNIFDGRSTGIGVEEQSPRFLLDYSGNGTTGSGVDVPYVHLLAATVRLLSGGPSGAATDKNSLFIAAALVLALPVCRVALGGEWLSGFSIIATVVLLATLAANKK